MPVEFLTDDEAAGYGRYAGVPSQADLERVFFLDDEDRALIDRHRGEHMKLGFALQLVTVRWVGAFLEDPLDVPLAVLDFVAEQLEIADPSCVKRYTERRKTRLDHQWEIRRVCDLKEFTAVEALPQPPHRVDEDRAAAGAPQARPPRRPLHPAHTPGQAVHRRPARLRERVLWRMLYETA